MTTPNYQLILQFPCDSMEDFDAVIHLEAALLAEFLGSGVNVDGHDMGAGVVNVFVLTADPVGSFKRAQPVIAVFPELDAKLRAAFRNLAGDDYSILWPPELTRFKLA